MSGISWRSLRAPSSAASWLADTPFPASTEPVRPLREQRRDDTTTRGGFIHGCVLLEPGGRFGGSTTRWRLRFSTSGWEGGRYSVTIAAHVGVYIYAALITMWS